MQDSLVDSKSLLHLLQQAKAQSEPTRRVPQLSCPASYMFPEIWEAGSNDTYRDILFLPAADTSLALKNSARPQSEQAAA